MSDLLWSKGTLANIDIHSITAQEKLSIEDVEADTEKASADIVRLGTKSLFSKKMLEPLRRSEAKARQILYLYSTSFPIGGLRFITEASLPKLQEKLDQITAAHKAAVNNLLEMFDPYRDEMIATYPDQLSAPDYEKTRSLLMRGRCNISFSTFNLDFTGQSKREEQNVLEEFTAQAIKDLRETVGSAAARLAAAIAQGKRVSEKSLNAMKRLIERSRDANFVCDPAVESCLSLLESELNLRSAKALREDQSEAESFRRSLDLIVEETSQEDVSSVVSGFLGRTLDMDAPAPVTDIPFAQSPARDLELVWEA